jgi:predicted ATPase
MAHLTQEMIYKRDNQYFIATHSPFILNDLLENGRNDLAVFVVHYEDHETKVRKLSVDEMHDVFQSGVDLFTNNESFV